MLTQTPETWWVSVTPALSRVHTFTCPIPLAWRARLFQAPATPPPPGGRKKEERPREGGRSPARGASRLGTWRLEGCGLGAFLAAAAVRLCPRAAPPRPARSRRTPLCPASRSLAGPQRSRGGGGGAPNDLGAHAGNPALSRTNFEWRTMSSASEEKRGRARRKCT